MCAPYGILAAFAVEIGSGIRSSRRRRIGTPVHGGGFLAGQGVGALIQHMTLRAEDRQTAELPSTGALKRTAASTDQEHHRLGQFSGGAAQLGDTSRDWTLTLFPRHFGELRDARSADRRPRRSAYRSETRENGENSLELSGLGST